MSSISDLLVEIDEDLSKMEGRTESVRAGKAIIRQVDRLVTAVDEFEKSYGDLPVAYDMTWADAFEADLDKGSLDAVGEKIATLQGALKAAKLIGVPDAEVVQGQQLVERYEAAKNAKPGKSAFSPGSARNLGVPIHVSCSCGDFTAVSNVGDWSSIRYAAKTHAATCDRANPGLSETLMNDLDRVRDSIVKQRKDTTSGGLSFFVEGGATSDHGDPGAS